MRWRRMGFKEFIKKHTDIKVSLNQPLPDVRQHEQLGFYGLFIRSERTWMHVSTHAEAVHSPKNSLTTIGFTVTPSSIVYLLVHSATASWQALPMDSFVHTQSVFTRVCLRHLRKCLVFLVPVVESLPKLWDSANHTYFIKRFNQLDQIKQQWMVGPLFA